MKFSIVIPCYNEQMNIPLLFKRFSNVIKEDNCEVIFVNNGSTDNSSIILDKLSLKHKFAKIITIRENKGYGYGIISGLKQAKGDFIGWTHADMQTDPKDVIKAFKIIEKKSFSKNIYIKGRRRKRPGLDIFFTIGMSIFETVFLKRIFWDINAQPNIFHKSFFYKLTDLPNDFSFDLYIYYMAKMNKLDIVRFNVRFPERVHGISKWNTGFLSKLKFIKRTVLFSLKLKKDFK